MAGYANAWTSLLRLVPSGLVASSSLILQQSSAWTILLALTANCQDPPTYSTTSNPSSTLRPPDHGVAADSFGPQQPSPTPKATLSNQTSHNAEPRSRIGPVVLDQVDRDSEADLIRNLPLPKKPCLPLDNLHGRKLYGATIQDCAYDLTPAELYDPSRCDGDFAGRTREPQSFYCPEGVGPYFGRLVRLRDVSLTISEEAPRTCTAVACPKARAYTSPCCWQSGPYPCRGAWWGRVGVQLHEHVVPLVSVAGYADVECGRAWLDHVKHVPDRPPRPPRCQPICQPWVWKPQTLVVRPSGLGLKLVLPPPGIDKKYLLPEDPLPR